MDSIMSETNNSDSSCESVNFDNEPQNLSSANTAGNKRHRIILLASPSKEGPSVPKYLKLSDSHEIDTNKNEGNSSGIVYLPEEQKSPIIAKLSPLIIRNNTTDKVNNNFEKSLFLPVTTNKIGKTDCEYSDATEGTNKSNLHNDSISADLTDEVTNGLEHHSDKEETGESDKEGYGESENDEEENQESDKETRIEEKTDDNQLHNYHTTNEVSHNSNGGSKQCRAIIQNLYNTQVVTPTGPTRLGFLINDHKSSRLDSNGNPGVSHDHLYLEQANPNLPSTSADHMYQIANISDDSEHNELLGSKAYSFSDLNIAQLILSLKQDVQELASKVDKQESILKAVVSVNQFNLRPLFAQNFPEKYNLQVPFSKIQDFLKFNEDLSRNIDFCNEFIASLCSYIDNNVTLSKNIMNMLKVYMSKEVAVLFTAVRPTGNKMVLKDTLFCKCLLQAAKLSIRHGLLPLEFEKSFLKHLGLVIGNAKNWHEENCNSKENSQEQF